MHRVLAALALSASLVACSDAQTPSSSSPEREEIEQIVRSYILENPEIIEEALIELQRRARAREQQAVVSAVNVNAQQIYEDARDPVVGPADAPVTIVEFFDYRCSFCMLTNDWLQNVAEEHGDEVRIIFKEFPIRGAESTEGALAALAVWEQQPEAYLAFHDGLMSANGPLPSQRIDQIAEANGVDVASMRAAMDDDALLAHINDVRSLAQRVGITGTPFFIIGDEIIPGADMDRMQSALDAALAAAG
jgi:protein-disulfide isomerase